MAKSYLVSVRGSFAFRTKEVEEALRASGVPGLRCRNVSALYRLTGELEPRDAETIATSLLCDPIVERFQIDAEPSGKKAVYLDVWYRSGVTDAVGDSVLKAAREMKLGGVESAAAGTRYEFLVRSHAPSLEKNLLHFSNRQLLNPLVQECRIHRP